MDQKNTGKFYENLVSEICQALLDYENTDADYKKIEVLHNVKLKGKSGNLHQIDVYWAFTLFGAKYETLVEVKDWKNPVKMEQINSFKEVLDDIPGFPKGYYVSKSGFQSGTERTARYHGIKLFVVDKSKSLKVLVDNIVTYYEGTHLWVDEEWIQKGKIAKSEVEQHDYSINQEDVILLNPQNIQVRLYDLMCDNAIPFYYEPDNVCHMVKQELDGEWFWITGNSKIPMIKIVGYEYKCYNKSNCTKLEVDVPNYIIMDILDQKKHLYNTATKEIQLNITEDSLV